jgi:hypothetical protein
MIAKRHRLLLSPVAQRETPLRCSRGGGKLLFAIALAPDLLGYHYVYIF